MYMIYRSLYRQLCCFIRHKELELVTEIIIFFFKSREISDITYLLVCRRPVELYYRRKMDYKRKIN